MNFAIAALPHGAKTIFRGGTRLRSIRAKQSTSSGLRRLLFLWRADRIGTPSSQETQTRKIRLAIRWPSRQPTPFQTGI
jgi:hypothetical protein